MVGSSKILTVSYGTFSCTLEGFDDSFGTMKAIAEYFRDLAADDRYFGAEPPVPDAEMLARIAEREVARRVEARLDGKGVTLRTGDALPHDDAADAQPVPQAIEIAAPQGPVTSAATPVAPTRPVMRQVISQSAPAVETNTAIPLMPPVVVAPMPPVQPMVANTAPVIAPPRVTPLPPATPVQTFWPTAVPTTVPTVNHAVHAPPQAGLPAHPDADSVAAKLQRIRAVVGRNAVPMTTQEFAEDLGDVMAGPDLAAPPAAIHGDQDMDVPEMTALHSLADQWADLTENAALATPDGFDAQDDSAGPETAFDMAAFASALTAEPTEAAETADESATHQPEPAPVRARIIKVRRSDFDAATAPILPDVAMTKDDQKPDTAPEDYSDIDGLTDLDGIGDLMALDGMTDEQADDDSGLATSLVATDVDSDFGDGSLPPDAEAELLEELAALEREAGLADDAQEVAAIVTDVTDTDEMSAFSMANVLAATAEEAPTPALDQNGENLDDAEALFDLPSDVDATFDFATLAEDHPAVAEEDDAPEVTPLRLGRNLLEREPEADAEAMERILSQTDAELNSPENSRRREAISQLKAAVAATEAARLLGEKSAETEADDVETAFRDDLKQAVRPRRPIGEVNPDMRSERPRPAPLKLVASQRIDIPAPRPAPKSVMPVRPRRVAVQDDQGAAAPAATHLSAGSFAEFAANMGASELPDLLEAAAAYTSFVEGVEDFSRPQLMKKVQDMAEQDYSREDGLRSFGTLLRQGRIMKTANGRFVVNEESRFNPERKSA